MKDLGPGYEIWCDANNSVRRDSNNLSYVINSIKTKENKEKFTASV